MSSTQNNEKIIGIHRPGLKEKFFFFLSGTIVSIPFTLYTRTLTSQLCVLMPILYARICSTAIFTPFVEEFAKAYPLLYRHGETERSIFTLGFIVGLGFGITEFFMYVFLVRTPMYIRLPVIFFHAASTSITAYGIARDRPWLYLVAVTLHFLNNLGAIFGLLWLIYGFPTLIVALFLSWTFYWKTSPVRFSD